MSVEKNPRGGFQLKSAEDIQRIERRSEREFARYLFTKRRVYDIWFEPHVYAPDEELPVPTGKRSTVPDFLLVKKSNGLQVVLEITIQPKVRKVDSQVIENDPKAEHKIIMAYAAPQIPYLVYQREQLEKIAKHGGYDFFSEPQVFKRKRRVSEAHRQKRRAA
ncbi:MAG: hypothetical protein ACM3IJ_01160 [Candidatus Levyibacteriota bacterium]